MNRFFSQDSIAMRFLTFLCDMMYINFLFFVFSIPIFTMGASLSAMYNVLFKRIRDEDPPIMKTFTKAFKENFKQATSIWVPFLLIICFLFASLYVAHNLIGDTYSVLQYPIAIFIFLILAVFVFVFPQIAVFQTPTKQILKNACLLSLGNLPTTLSVLIVHVFLLLLAGLSPTMTYVVGSVILFLGYATISYFFSHLFRKIFNKIMGGEEDAV